MSYMNRQTRLVIENSNPALQLRKFTDDRPVANIQHKQQQHMHSTQQVSQLAAAQCPTKDMLPIQRQNYSKTVIRPAGFNQHQWPTSLSTGGSKADSSIASDVNETLVSLGWSGNLMSAHMIPNRIGGKGNNSNVRPWQRSFEEGTWEKEVEKNFDQNLARANPGDSLTYSVNTTDMTDTEADNILAGGGIKTTDPKYNSHRHRLKKIPTSVSANGKGPYSECMPDQPWSFLKKLAVVGGVLLGAGLLALSL